jgi:hypothetical protein
LKFTPPHKKIALGYPRAKLFSMILMEKNEQIML